MATVIEKPGEGLLNCPPPGNHLEAFSLFVSRRLQVDFVRLLQPPYPLFKPRGRISTIDPYLAQPLDPIGKIRGQQRDQSQTIIRASVGHHHGNEQPQSVDEQMPLAPFDLLVAIKPNVLALRRRFDALRVNATSGGFRLSTQTASLPLAQHLHQTRPDALASPPLEVAIDRTPVPKLLGKHPPLAARLIEVQNAVDDPPHVA